MTQDVEENLTLHGGILSLPDDVLLEILAQCDKQTLGRLARVCKKFQRLTNDHYVWVTVSKKMTLVGATAEAVLKCVLQLLLF